jgi:hypothetical protein
MAAVIAVVIAFIAMGVLAAASAAWGVDSRESFPDDHRR